MKKLSISSDVLKKVLPKLSLAINPKQIIAELGNIFCKVEKDSVELICCDLELTISAKCVAETEGYPFEILLPFEFLNKIIGVTKPCPVLIEHPSARKASIITDGDRYECNSLDKVDAYPKLPAAPKKGGLKLDASFTDRLHDAMLTAGRDENMPALQNACMDMSDVETFLVSTDLETLYRHKIEGAAPTEQVMISKKVSEALTGLSEIEFTWSAKMMSFKTDTITVWSRRHEGVFPDYKRIIPKYAANIEIERSALVEALTKACISSGSKATTFDMLGAGIVKMVTDDEINMRKIESKLKATYTVAVPSFRVNAKKLLTIMKQVREENIRLHVFKPEKAILISSETNEAYLGLIMPIFNK